MNIDNFPSVSQLLNFSGTVQNYVIFIQLPFYHNSKLFLKKEKWDKDLKRMTDLFSAWVLSGGR